MILQKSRGRQLLVDENVAPEVVVHVSDLKERPGRSYRLPSTGWEGPPPLVVSSMERLNSLLEKAEPPGFPPPFPSRNAAQAA